MKKGDFIYPDVNIESAKQLGLSVDEFHLIEKILHRTPNYVELGIFAALWSEHCSYKTSKIHLKKLPTKGKYVLQGPGENAGVIAFDKDLCVSFKVESHNHPSFLEPYQGAATGVGGILRDIFAMGARPEVLMDSLRFGNLENEHNAYLLERVVDGIADYGNCMGIPTIGGETFFDSTYEKNPLVNVFALGFVKRDNVAKAIVKNVHDKIIYVGAKTGRDGIHGATMASESFGKETQTKRVNVQIGDPFTEKLLMEACLELVEKKCIVGIQDMGAAGLTSSIFELATKSRKGLLINLDRVPLREEGMNPYEIMLSESQERMLVVAVDEKISEIKDIFDKWDLSMEIIGEVVESDNVTIKWYDEVVADIPINELEYLSPIYDRPYRKRENTFKEKKEKVDSFIYHNNIDHNEVLKGLLKNLNIASKSWIYEQYDYMVRTNTIVFPGSDASVIRVKGINRAVAISADGNGTLCYLDPYIGAKHAVCEALVNIASAGAKPLGITNCLNFGNPENPHVMWEFVEVIRGMKDACEALEVPIVSGNVSFYNETEGLNIKPTPVIVAVGRIDDIKNVKNSFFKCENSNIVMLGKNKCALMGSIYANFYLTNLDEALSDVDLQYVNRFIMLLTTLVNRGLVEAVHDVSDGGLAVTIAEMTLGRKIGANIEFNEDLEDHFIYSEEKPRVIVEVKNENLVPFQKCCEEVHIETEIIGKTNNEGKLSIKNKSKKLIDIDITLLHGIYNEALKKCLN
jgi:phosphoribosylformylglycinamidine synthase